MPSQLTTGRADYKGHCGEHPFYRRVKRRGDNSFFEKRHKMKRAAVFQTLRRYSSEYLRGNCIYPGIMPPLFLTNMGCFAAKMA
jgi:hypothetical protein